MKSLYLPDEPGYFGILVPPGAAAIFSDAVRVRRGRNIGFSGYPHGPVVHGPAREDEERGCGSSDMSPGQTPASGNIDIWVARRAAAIVAGAFCLSSRFQRPQCEEDFGGTGWIVEPEEGAVDGPGRPAALVADPGCGYCGGQSGRKGLSAGMCRR
ncbi:MAG: hypothetical protein U5K27_02870 [Desulfotignum sp.]|nr:hypothetical protein [Desulfotignum sp.]